MYYMDEKRLQMDVQHMEHFMKGAHIVVARLGRTRPKQEYYMDEKRLQMGMQRVEHFKQGASSIVVARLGRAHPK
jgi:hypothetical protein